MENLKKDLIRFAERIDPDSHFLEEQWRTIAQAPDSLSVDELRKVEEGIRSMIAHDNELLNHRIQWFLTLNGFLFTAVAIHGNQQGRQIFGSVIAVVGLLCAVTFGMALKIGRRAFHRLTSLWEAYQAAYVSEGSYAAAGVRGYLAPPGFIRLVPWKTLPVIMGCAWIAIGGYVWAAYLLNWRSIGTFTAVELTAPAETAIGAEKPQGDRPNPIAENRASKRTVILDTSTGEFLK